MDNQTTQTTIYIGLNDSETGVQKFDTEKYTSILKMVCRSYHIPFSVQRIEGGYFHENGMYVEETTLALIMMDISMETVNEIAKDLCAFFNQESVMITSAPCTVVFVKESLRDKNVEETAK